MMTEFNFEWKQNRCTAVSVCSASICLCCFTIKIRTCCRDLFSD